MFDSVGAFKRQFTRTDGGYVYYPSSKSGGKLVTEDEYEAMVADWQRIAGTREVWKTVGLAFLAILLWTVVSQPLSLQKSYDWIIIAVSVAALSGWLLWASLAPRRLVRDRPYVTPPRTTTEARREARATLNWPFVLFVLLFSGAIFFGRLTSSDRTQSWWVWVIVSGFFFAAYLWIAVQKLRDRRR